MLEQLRIRKGKTFIVCTNNTTTEGVIRKRKSKDRTVNEEWKKIQASLVRLQTDLEAQHVLSKEN
jgi:predicted RNA-binding protein with PUA domain